jgi:hypothetical protein
MSVTLSMLPPKEARGFFMLTFSFSKEKVGRPDTLVGHSWRDMSVAPTKRRGGFQNRPAGHTSYAKPAWLGQKVRHG